MQETLRGLIHSFVLHNFLTNTSHPTHVLLRRIVIFYHLGLVEDKIPESGMFNVSFIGPLLIHTVQTHPLLTCQMSPTLMV